MMGSSAWSITPRVLCCVWKAGVEETIVAILIGKPPQNCQTFMLKSEMNGKKQINASIFCDKIGTVWRGAAIGFWNHYERRWRPRNNIKIFSINITQVDARAYFQMKSLSHSWLVHQVTRLQSRTWDDEGYACANLWSNLWLQINHYQSDWVSKQLIKRKRKTEDTVICGAAL